MKIKKWLCMILAVALLSAPINLGFAELKPILGIEAGDEVQSFDAGAKGEFALNVKNVASMVAQNIRVTIKGNHPFRSDVGNLTKTFTYLNPNEVKKLLFNLTISPLAEPKLYEFEVLIEYESLTGEVYTVTEKAFVRVTNGLTKPSVSVVDVKTGADALAPGTPDSLVLWLKNSGEIDAEEVKVSITGMSNEGVVLYKDTDVKVIGDIDAKATRNMYFNIISGKMAKKGTAELKVKIDYIDAYGGSYTKESTVYVNLEGKESLKPKISIEKIVYPEVFDKEKSNIVTAEVVNNGLETLKNLEVSCKLPEGFYSKTVSVLHIDSLKPGERYAVRFEVGAESSVEKGSYQGSLVVQTPDLEDESVMRETKAYLGLLIESSEASTSKPRLIVENYNTGGEMVMTGEPFTLFVSIKNTSKLEAVQNIKLNFTSVDNQFITVDTSNAQYIDRISPGGVKTVELRLKPNKNTVPGAYALTLDMEYEDVEGKAYDSQNKPFAEKELINIEVGQELRLEVGDLTIPKEVSAGETFYLEQEFYNMGKAKIANLLIKQEGLESQEGSMFLGELTAGSKDTFTAECYVDKPGNYEGKIIYQFEDALGQTKTIEKTFKLVATEPKPDEDVQVTTDDFEEEPVKKEATVELWHVVLAFAIIMGALLLLKGKKK